MIDIQRLVALRQRAQDEVDRCDAQLEHALKDLRKNWITAERKWASSVLNLAEARKADSESRTDLPPYYPSQSVKICEQKLEESHNDVAREHNIYLLACKCAGWEKLA